MFARFDFKIIMKQNVTDGRTHGRMDNVKTVYPPQTKFAGVITSIMICGDRGTPHPLKITKILGSVAILVRIPLKLQSYKASIQSWAIIGMPAKLHLNGVLLVSQ